jgi:hypothetical protein
MSPRWTFGAPVISIFPLNGPKWRPHHHGPFSFAENLYFLLLQSIGPKTKFLPFQPRFPWHLAFPALPLSFLILPKKWILPPLGGIARIKGPAAAIFFKGTFMYYFAAGLGPFPLHHPPPPIF